MKRLNKPVLSHVLAALLMIGATSALSANTKRNMQNELDKEIEMALAGSNGTMRTNTVRKKTIKPRVKNFEKRSIHGFADTSNNIDRIKSEVGSTSTTSKRTSSYDEMINSSSSLKSDQIVNYIKPKKFGFNLYTYYSGAQTLYTTGNSLKKQQEFNSSLINSSALANGQYTSTGSYGFGLEHSKADMLFASNVGLGYALGATYEADREIDRGYIDQSGRSVSRDSFGRAIENPSLSLVLPYANMLVTYRNTYYLAGLNYSVPQMTAADDEIYEGGLGYQIGAGMDIGEYLALEATYRWINFSAAARTTDQFAFNNDSSSKKGLGLLADEDFALDGFNITLKVRF